MKTKMTIWAMAVLLAGSAWAITPNLDEGTKTIEGSGSLDGDTPFGTDFTLQLGLGYFIVDNLELAGVGSVRDNDEFTTYELGARVEYNFLTDTPFVPFAGAGILWASADGNEADREDTTVGRLSAGLKYFIDDNVALAVSAVYDKAADDIYIDDDGDAEDDNFQGLFSVRFYFD